MGRACWDFFEFRQVRTSVLEYIYIFQNSVIFGGTKIWNKRYFQRVGELDIQKIRPGLTLKSSNIIVIVLCISKY